MFIFDGLGMFIFDGLGIQHCRRLLRCWDGLKTGAFILIAKGRKYK
jgi:hypothetical protein